MPLSGVAGTKLPLMRETVRTQRPVGRAVRGLSGSRSGGRGDHTVAGGEHAEALL